MGGPRVTSGSDSKQDYSTQDDFLENVGSRFGPIQFDLAAHAANAKHARYFAPEMLTRKKLDLDKIRISAHLAGETLLPASPISRRVFIDSMVRQGAEEPEVIERLVELEAYRENNPGAPSEVDFVVKNRDKKAYGINAFAHSWAELSLKFRSPSTVLKDGSTPGLLWLNCEFSDIEPWARRSLEESQKGANILLLTPVAISNWFRDLCAGQADVYLLSGRLCFDGKNVFPKDCMLTHFHPRAEGKICIWNWKKNLTPVSWELAPAAPPSPKRNLVPMGKIGT